MPQWADGLTLVGKELSEKCHRKELENLQMSELLVEKDLELRNVALQLKKHEVASMIARYSVNGKLKCFGCFVIKIY